MARRHGRNNRNRNRPNRGGGPNNPNQQNRQNNGGGGNRQHAQQEKEPPAPVHIPKRYGIAFYDTFAQAKADVEGLTTKAKDVDQLNIVIKAEGNQWDPDLIKFGKLFAGEAWTLIHTRRVEEGWYNDPH